MAVFRIATVEEYRGIDPDWDIVPPLVTEDGDVEVVGKRGRLIPMIGRTRPPRLDVSTHPMDGGKLRVYADDPDDILAVLCGEDYQQRLMLCREMNSEYITLHNDSSADERRQYLRDEFYHNIDILQLIRGNLVHSTRQVAQGKINDRAMEAGTWEKLTDEEQEILTWAADTGSETAPVGIVKEMLIPDPLAQGQSFVGNRGTWTADVDLAINQADFLPYSRCPFPYSATTITGPDGTKYLDDCSNLNLKVIRVDNADNLLEDLQNLGVITMKERPIIPIDSDWRF